MQVDLMIGSSRWSDSAALARSVEAAGLSGMVFTETGQTPWLNILPPPWRLRRSPTPPGSPLRSG
jgi:hypothetical protein